jgi:hypothetical protein
MLTPYDLLYYLYCLGCRWWHLEVMSANWWACSVSRFQWWVLFLNILMPNPLFNSYISYFCSEGELICPAYHELCNTLHVPISGHCPKSCSFNGDCIDGTCHCFPGFHGHDCSKSECTLYLCFYSLGSQPVTSGITFSHPVITYSYFSQLFNLAMQERS